MATLNLVAGSGISLVESGPDLTMSVDPSLQTLAVSSGRSLSDADNGKALLCTGSFTLTIPTGLGAGFQCSIVALTGTVTFAAAGGVSVVPGVGDVEVNSQGGSAAAVGTIIQVASNTYRVIAGTRERFSFTVALSDETTDLTTGTSKVTMRAPFGMVLTGVRASLSAAATGSVVTVDINEGGTTILSTKLTIDASEKTSTTAATAAVISDANIADDAELTFDIDTVGSGSPGKGLKVTLLGYRA